MVPEVLCVAHNKLLTLFLCDLSSYPPLPPRRYPDPKLPSSDTREQEGRALPSASVSAGVRP